jgi:hypothetical protein
MAALAHSHGDEPLDPAEEPMSEADFQVIQRAHQLCDHAPARELTAEPDLEKAATTVFPPENSPPPVFQIIEKARPMLAQTRPTKERIRILWAAAKAARPLGAAAEINAAFLALAVEVNLIDKHGRWTGSDVRETVRRHGAEDVAHVIGWALRGWNPFEKGPLK